MGFKELFGFGQPQEIDQNQPDINPESSRRAAEERLSKGQHRKDTANDILSSLGDERVQ